MPEFTQDNRPLRISTPLGKDALLITGFSGQEEISRLFHFHVELAAPLGQTIDFAALLGKTVSVQLDLAGGDIGTRLFHGIVTRFSQGRRDSHVCLLPG